MRQALCGRQQNGVECSDFERRLGGMACSPRCQRRGMSGMRFVMAAAVNVEDLRESWAGPAGGLRSEIPFARHPCREPGLASLAAAGNPAEIGRDPSEEVQRGVPDLLPRPGGRSSAATCLHAKCTPNWGESRDPGPVPPAGLTLVRWRSGRRSRRSARWSALCEGGTSTRPSKRIPIRYIYDQETLAFLAANDAMLRQSGYSRDEPLSMTVRDLPPEDASAFLDMSARTSPAR